MKRGREHTDRETEQHQKIKTKRMIECEREEERIAELVVS